MELRNVKIDVGPAGITQELQVYLFSLGCKWSDSGISKLKIKYPYLYINNRDELTYGLDIHNFEAHQYKQITLKDLYPATSNIYRKSNKRKLI